MTTCLVLFQTLGVPEGHIEYLPPWHSQDNDGRLQVDRETEQGAWVGGRDAGRWVVDNKRRGRVSLGKEYARWREQQLQRP